MTTPPPPCSCPLSGWCERHQRTKSEHLHHLCQTDERYRANWDKEAPKQGVAAKAASLSSAVGKWIAAGRPVRNQDEIDSAFDVCKGCEFYKPAGAESGSCGKCGCYVNRRGMLNKIRMATESCPVGKW